jgi:sugar phosphate isomerase/epimerase
MQFGLGSYACAWAIGVPGYPVEQPLDALGFVQLAHELGFSLVQIADNLPLHTLSDREQALLLEHTRAQNLTVELGTRGIQRGQLETYLRLAQTFCSRILRVVVDSHNHHPSPDDVIRCIGAVLPQFESANVTLAIENHDRFTTRTLAGIITTLASPSVGICLDTVNSFGSLERPEVVIDALAPYTVNLHLKDFDIRRADHNMGFAIFGTPAGQGRLDIPGLIRQLKQHGRCQTAVLELWPAPEQTIDVTIAKERLWLRQSAAYLHSLQADEEIVRDCDACY